jgi:NTE family protein
MLQDLALGAVLGRAGLQSLLDASPLRPFLERHLPMARIAASIEAGHLYAIAVTATSYHSGKSFTFIQGQPGHPLWEKSRRVALPVTLTLDHVCASAAIPIVFQPVLVRSEVGEFYFGDGGLRLVTPFSPAIRLGADRILAVGIRCQRAADTLSAAERVGLGKYKPKMEQPPLSQICGVFLNAIFLDHLDADLDHLERMNELIRAYGGDARRVAPADPGPVREPMRLVEPLAINPSEDLAVVARAFAHRMPRVVRYFMDGLGTPDAQSADLMSYLLFDGSYAQELVAIGYRDAAARIDEIEAFVRAGNGSRPPKRRSPARERAGEPAQA